MVPSQPALTAEDVAKIVGALAGGLVVVLGAIGALYVKVRQYHSQVNGKLSEFLALTGEASHSAGQLEGLDLAAAAERAELAAYQAGKAAGIAQATAVKRWMAGVGETLPTEADTARQFDPPPAQADSPRPGGPT